MVSVLTDVLIFQWKPNEEILYASNIRPVNFPKTQAKFLTSVCHINKIPTQDTKKIYKQKVTIFPIRVQVILKLPPFITNIKHTHFRTVKTNKNRTHPNLFIEFSKLSKSTINLTISF